MDRDHVEPVVEVLAEPPGLHLDVEVAVGGRDDAHIDLDRLRAADRSYLVVLEHAQELGLEARSHVPDFVEEERAAIGALEQAALGRDGSRERAAHVAEQLALEQSLRNRGAVDREEGLVHATAVVMQCARHHLLARSALARDQDARVDVRGAADHREHVAHRRALADELLEAGAAVRTAQLAVVVFHRAAIERALHGANHFFGLERLGRVAERTRAHRVHCGVDAAERGHEHDRRVGAQLAQIADQLESRLARHLDVGEDDVEVGLARQLERGARGRSFRNHVTLLAEQRLEHLAHRAVVFDEQELCSSHICFLSRERLEDPRAG